MYWFYNPDAGKNFGDCIGPYLYQQIRGHMPILTTNRDQGEADILYTCGSILHKVFSDNRAVVWGSGAISKDISFKRPKEIISVRGPLSRSICLSLGYPCPEIYGDPGILLPLFYLPGYEKTRWRMGIIPHFVDYDDLKKVFISHLDVKIIDVKRDVTEVIDDILLCDTIVSTSLHGVIVSMAYRKPVLWARYSDLIIGGNFKFEDFYLGVGCDRLPKPFCLQSDYSIELLEERALSAPVLPSDFDTQKLMACCPI
jgi:hypothetical protein